MMNFDGLDPGMGDYPPALHASLDPGMEQSLDPRLDPSLLQSVELDPAGLPVPVQGSDSVHLPEGMYSELHSVVSEGGVPVCASHFDLQEELLWIGNHRGHATSFFGPTMGRYSSFQVHASDDIRQIHSMESGVLFLSKSNLKCVTRGGLVMFDYLMEESADMHSLLLTDNTTALVGGLQNYVTQIDLNTVQETQKFSVEVPGVAIMRHSNRFFFCGHTSGKVSLRDLRSFTLEQEFDAYSGSLSDFDVHGNLLVTCGFSSRMSGQACERFLMVYDLRMMRAISPLQVHVDPLFLRFIPTYTSRLAIISQTGQCQFCEPTGLANLADVFHVNTVGQLMSFDVSSSKGWGRKISNYYISSAHCCHPYADLGAAKTNTRCPLKHVQSADCFFSHCRLAMQPPWSYSVGGQRSSGQLAGKPAVDPEILRTMKTVGFIGYAPNPRNRLRNQARASNFLRAFRTIPEASALGLILADSDEQTGKVNLGRLIQSWNRFILTHLHQETQEQEGPQAYRGVSNSAFGSSGESVIGRLFGCEVENSSTCRCGKETVRSSLTLLFTIHYPDLSTADKIIKEYDFSEILKRSICLEQNTQAWCENCEKYQPTVQTRNIRCLPDVLVINCEVNSTKEAEFWEAQAQVQTRNIRCLPDVLVINCEVNSTKEAEFWEAQAQCEAAQFDLSWKVPAILYYTKRNCHSKYDLRIKNPIEASVLLAEASLARKQRKSHATFIPLMLSEMPQAGDLVGLDAEFVTLNQVLKDQVIDTVYLFHMPRKRMISLRFLAWYFLDLKIQSETHDSTEDARTALQLYRKYLMLSSKGSRPEEFRKVLKGLYEKGRKIDWKVPDCEGAENQNSPKSKSFPSNLPSITTSKEVL
ncbi:UNVERIFIED_CONTAM: hypothetical protein FKN15_078252 [Acipenser sinensis]